MLGSIKYNLTNLTNFNGRDARQTFWYYVLFLVVIQYVLGIAITVPMMVQGFSSAFQAASSGMDSAALEQQMNTQMLAAMQDAIWIQIAIGSVGALLLVAAVVRRLHDSDHSGWWAVLPFALYAFVLARSPEVMRRAFEMAQAAETAAPFDALAMMKGQLAESVLGWVPYLLVIILGVLKSTPGPNRFGEAPVSY